MDLIIAAIEIARKEDAYVDLLTFCKILIKSYDPNECIDTREAMEEKIKNALDHLYRGEV